MPDFPYLKAMMQNFKAKWGRDSGLTLCFGPREEGVTWVNFCWVCAAGLSESLPHYSLFCRGIRDPNLVTFCLCIYFIKPFN